MSEATAAVLLFEGFEELDALGPYDVLRTASEAGAPLATVTQVTVEDGDVVTASKGTQVVPHERLDPDAPPDYLVVPGGGWVAREDKHSESSNRASGSDRRERHASSEETGAWAAVERGVVPDAVADCHAAGTTVASVCTGAMLLARAGLLDGRLATTHQSALVDLEATDARVVEARVVDSGDVLTAGGVTAGLDLALWLVEREWGRDLATSVAESLEYDRSPEVYRSGR